MARGRHAAPPDHTMARAVVGSTAAVGLASGGFLAITPEQVRADAATVSEPQPDTRPMQRVTVTATEPVAVSSASAKYVVQPGNTLGGIGETVNEAWQAIYADNRGVVGPNPDRIMPGQTLLLDSAPPTTPVTTVTPHVAVTAPHVAVTAPIPPSSGGRHRAVTDGMDVVAQAETYLGVPYVWGGSSRAGMDCSGLVLRVFDDLRVEQLPHSSAAQSHIGTLVNGLGNAQPGDLLFFDNPVGHVAIYVGGGQMIAAPTFGDVVKVQKVYTTPTVIRRLV